MYPMIEEAYISKRKPECLDSIQIKDRRAIISKMLDNRKIPRLLVAPKGYGKKCICELYSRIVFYSKNILWLDCGDPCFIIDLDSGNLVKKINEAEIKPNLMIFDALPNMDESRIKEFSSIVKRFLIQGTEIIINMTPSAFEPYVETEFKGCTILPKEFLIPLAQIDPNEARVVGEDLCNSTLLAPFGIWKSDNFKSCLEEDLSIGNSRMKLLKFVLYLVGSGSNPDLYHVLFTESSKGDFRTLEKSYPHFGIDINNFGFNVQLFDVNDVLSAIEENKNDILKISKCKSWNELICKIATVLAKNKNFKRAEELLKCQLSAYEVESWVIENSDEYISSLAFQEHLDILKKIEASKNRYVNTILLLMLIDYYCLCNFDKVRETAYKLSKPEVKSHLTRALGLCFRSRTENDNYRDAILFNILELTEKDDFGKNYPYDSELLFDKSEIAELCNFLILMEDNFDGAITFLLEKLEDSNKISSIFCLCACWLCDEFCNIYDGDNLVKDVRTNKKIDWDLRKELILSLFSSLMSIDSVYVNDSLSKLLFMVCSSKIFEIGSRHQDFAVRIDNPSFEVMIKQFIKKMTNLRESIATEEGFDQELYSGESNYTNAKQARNLILQRSLNKKLSINLFGSFTISKGSMTLSRGIYSMRKPMIAIAVLALKKGYEVTREELISILWAKSKSSDTCKRRNYYNVISRVKDILGHFGSVNSILHKTRGGYFLDDDNVYCDLDDFHEICSALLFSKDLSKTWKSLFNRISSNFSSRLLTNINGCEYIDEKREEYASQLLDCISTGSERLLEEGHARGALWLMRQANCMDKSREDVYMNMMKCQMSLNQRSEAISTYFQCKSNMNRIFGLHPSREVESLYRQVLEK